MKPELELITGPTQHSFIIKQVDRQNRPTLNEAWHFHPEIEICFTLKSSGRRFVGNIISDYKEGDLVMFGPNLPHGFTTNLNTSQLVIQMSEHFLGNEFMARPELAPIRSLFNRSKCGLFFGAKTRKKAEKLIRKIVRKKQMNQLICLLELLAVLAQAEDQEEICKDEMGMDTSTKQLGRINKVYDYMKENFKNEVKVQAVADMLNISEAAFYKLIKKQTKKTYTQIINEFRINHATKLMMNTDKSISQICFECGFNNVSYFNRTFKKIMSHTPLNFKKQYSDA